jgi:hypothetical protein
MGGLFSKKEKSRITEQDKAVLSLKKQRDQARACAVGHFFRTVALFAWGIPIQRNFPYPA